MSATYPVTFDCNGQAFVVHNASYENLYYVYECGQNEHITSMPTSFTNTFTASSGMQTMTWPGVEFGNNSEPLTLHCGNDTIEVNGEYSDIEAAFECGLKQSLQDQADETSGAAAKNVTMLGLLVALLALSVFL